MSFNYSKLRGKIREVYGAEGKFAHKLGISHNSFGKKLNGRSPFTCQEMDKIINLLGIDDKSIAEYFFTPAFAKANGAEETPV
jgi:hypothetical protein